MVYISGMDTFCRTCGTFIGRRRCYKRSGFEFCKIECFASWYGENHDNVTDLTSYRSVRKEEMNALKSMRQSDL